LAVKNTSLRSMRDKLHIIGHGFEDPGLLSHRKERSVTTVGLVNAENWIRKGHRDFVDAASRMPDVKAYLVGALADTNLGSSIRAKAGLNVHVTGFLPDGELDALFLYARGSADDKGPIWSHLWAIELMDALGMTPSVNVKFIFDGEEEIASPFFGPFTEAHRDLLAADVVIVTDGPKHASGRPTITGGARGVVKLELEIEAARRDVHSGNIAAPNPAWKLSGLLASMATPDGVPLIEGFEEDVVGPPAGERQLMAEFPLDLPALEKDLGVRLPADYLDRLMFHPTLTIRVLHSGFVGAEANTIIPHTATVAIDVRMVRNQRWSKVYRRLIDHIRAQGFTVIESADEPLPDELRGRAVRVVDKAGYDPAKTSLDLPVSREIIQVVERAHGGRRAVLAPTAGGSVPIWAFTDILGLPTLLVPYANANNRQHSPNEHLKLDHLFQGVRTTAQLLTDL